MRSFRIEGRRGAHDRDECGCYDPLHKAAVFVGKSGIRLCPPNSRGEQDQGSCTEAKPHFPLGHLGVSPCAKSAGFSPLAAHWNCSLAVQEVKRC